MSNKQTHVISPELNMNAQFKQIDHIPTNHLQAGDVIQVLPGSYTDPRTTSEVKEKLKEKLSVIKTLYPMKLSEAEPNKTS